jgi:hypothetical protein
LLRCNDGRTAVTLTARLGRTIGFDTRSLAAMSALYLERTPFWARSDMAWLDN